MAAFRRYAFGRFIRRPYSRPFKFVWLSQTSLYFIQEKIPFFFTFQSLVQLTCDVIARGRKSASGKTRKQDRGLKRADGARFIDPAQRWLYDTLLLHERKHWEPYLTRRMQARVWVNAQIVDRLRAIPRTTPQAHRWHLLRAHLNGHSRRVAAAFPTDARLGSRRVVRR